MNFEIPFDLLAKVASGELVRFGAILKEASSGKIVAHLQETGVVQSLLSTASSGIFAPFSLVNDLVQTGSALVTAAQVFQIKNMVAALQGMQIATLGISLVGLGVTAGGFIYMHQRFGAIEERVNQVAEAVEKGFEKKRREELRSRLGGVNVIMSKARLTPHLSDSFGGRVRYRELADEIHPHAQFFKDEIAHIVAGDAKSEIEALQHALQMLILCNNMRMDCELRSNELGHAIAVSEEIADDYQSLFFGMTPKTFGGASERSLAALATVRDVTDAAATKPFLLHCLRKQNISGDQYMAALDAEDRAPLMMLRQA